MWNNLLLFSYFNVTSANGPLKFNGELFLLYLYLLPLFCLSFPAFLPSSPSDYFKKLPNRSRTRKTEHSAI
jgi:hypothetical protein